MDFPTHNMDDNCCCFTFWWLLLRWFIIVHVASTKQATVLSSFPFLKSFSKQTKSYRLQMQMFFDFQIDLQYHDRQRSFFSQIQLNKSDTHERTTASLSPRTSFLRDAERFREKKKATTTKPVDSTAWSNSFLVSNAGQFSLLSSCCCGGGRNESGAKHKQQQQHVQQASAHKPKSRCCSVAGWLAGCEGILETQRNWRNRFRGRHLHAASIRGCWAALFRRMYFRHVFATFFQNDTILSKGRSAMRGRFITAFIDFRKDIKLRANKCAGNALCSWSITVCLGKNCNKFD